MSTHALGAILSQKQSDGLLHPVAYASRTLSRAEANYGTTELETLAVVWAMTYFRSYLYGQHVTVYTDHSAVKAILETPSPTGKHARWWTRLYGSGVATVKIIHHSGKLNANADALSRSPLNSTLGWDLGQGEVQVSQVTGEAKSKTMELTQVPLESEDMTFSDEQRRDADLHEIITFLEAAELPHDDRRARKVTLQSPMLWFLQHKCCELIDETHRELFGGHFSGDQVYHTLAQHLWWEGMYSDVLKRIQSCPECTVATGVGRVRKLPLYPIPVSRPFQIWVVNIMDLPKTKRGNQHVVVFKDLFSKWPMVYPIPDQKAIRIAHLLGDCSHVWGPRRPLVGSRCQSLVPCYGGSVPYFGVKKLNTTLYHPQCDGCVEQFNRILKSMLQKHAARFGNQWDVYLPGVLWAYRNTPHASMGENHSSNTHHILY